MYDRRKFARCSLRRHVVPSADGALHSHGGHFAVGRRFRVKKTSDSGSREIEKKCSMFTVQVLQRHVTVSACFSPVYCCFCEVGRSDKELFKHISDNITPNNASVNTRF